MEGVRKHQWGMEALGLRSSGFGICHSFVCRADFICLISWKGGPFLAHWSACGLPHTVKVKSLSRVWLFVTLWTIARQALLSMGFSRQEFWSGLPFPSPGDLPVPGIKPGSHIAGRRFNLWATGEALSHCIQRQKSWSFKLHLDFSLVKGIWIAELF